MNKILTRPLTVFILGGLLCAINYWRIEIGSNQEIYMALAKWWADPSWIPGSFYLSDPPGTRIGFTAILLPFWKYFSFEQVSIGATLVNLFLLGGAWFLLLKEVTKLNFLYVVLIHLTLYSGIGFLSFYAGEWMFGEAEPKTFAYFFCLLALYKFMVKKETWAFFLLAIAAYFHVLVAGWILAILLLETLFTSGTKKTIQSFAIFLAGIVPLFLYLVKEYFGAGVSSFKGADEIFIASLNNHLRPWTVEGRADRFYTGLVASIISFGIAFYRMKKTEGKLAMVYRLSIFSFIVPTFVLLFAPWDWFNPFLKLFPFRLTLMQKLLVIIGLVTELSLFLEKKAAWKKYLNALAALVLVVSCGLRFNKNIMKRLAEAPDQDLEQISLFLSQQFQPGTVICYLDTDTQKADDAFDPLTRKSRMNVFFVNKFLPFSPGKIIEWKKRLDLTESIRKDQSLVTQLKDHKVEVVISKKPLTHSSLKQVHAVKDYKVYTWIADLNNLVGP